MIWGAVHNSALVHCARNALAWDFLVSDASHLLFIDADMGWEAAAVLRLLAHDLDVVCGLYPYKTLPLAWDYAPLAGASPGPGGLVEISAASAGFLCIHRRALLRMAKAYPERRFRMGDGGPTDGFDFFPSGLIHDGMQSEDFGFCRLWKAIGGRIWADLTIRLVHHGQHAFAGDPMTLIAPEMPAAAAA